MKTKTTIILATVIILLSLIAGAFVYEQLPDTMASHWGPDGQVDGYMGKFWATFMVPLTSLFVLGLYLIIPYLDPLKENIAKFREAFNLFIILIIAFLGYVWALTIIWNLGKTSFDMSGAILPAVGILFFFVGYMLRKAKRNWFIGIRTPWTLSSDKVWDETHRLGATLFMVSGALALLGAFFGDKAIWFILIPVFGTTIFLYAYSYVLYQNETKPAG